jgi:Stage II sporulation protein E (SpoIIE)
MSSLQKTRSVSCPVRRSSRDTRMPLPSTDALLAAAAQVHKALSAPATQRIGSFEVACATAAARRVSGDFVISFRAGEHSYIALGDLMGKGVAAAMWLTHVIDVLKRACEYSGELHEVMRVLNKEMYASRVGVPLTSLFLAHMEKNRVTYSCAGCLPDEGRQFRDFVAQGRPDPGRPRRSFLQHGSRGILLRRHAACHIGRHHRGTSRARVRTSSRSGD